jgi:hypothetical protein
LRSGAQRASRETASRDLEWADIVIGSLAGSVKAAWPVPRAPL